MARGSFRSILSNLKRPSLPIIAIELGNRVLGIFGGLEGYDTGSPIMAIGGSKDVNTND
jgi:hypothetical protein